MELSSFDTRKNKFANIYNTLHIMVAMLLYRITNDKNKLIILKIMLNPRFTNQSKKKGRMIMKKKLFAIFSMLTFIISFNFIKPSKIVVQAATAISVTYQTHDDVNNAWLPNVVDTQDYAAIVI